MYIHLKEMHLPPAISRSSNTPIRISAPMPQHFVWMLKSFAYSKEGDSIDFSYAEFLVLIATDINSH
ncbi:hypothetical protein KIN20_010770 [Parelaphostrongylus tenuis]|uniref:Uncharacterized protein n=1 Tax=Parelaphostrongylus tenuis TaxID=148309 RepID=A0AAD5QM12_PARTN|nr:hypothetical protein KIN20_010770 [Parelaphostrongylus tenuis]